MTARKQEREDTLCRIEAINTERKPLKWPVEAERTFETSAFKRMIAAFRRGERSVQWPQR